MPYEQVTIETGGMQYSQWVEAAVECGAAQASRSFSIICSEPNQLFGDAWVFKPGTEITIRATGSLLLKGYVDTYAPDIGPKNHRAVISGRSKSKDIVDCSAVHKTGEWKKKKPKEIAEDLCKPFKVRVESDVEGKEIPVWRLAPGSTVFEEIEALARHQGLLIIGTADGGIKLTRADKFQMHSGALVEGANIIEASAQLSEKGKYSDVIARGQSGLGSGADAQRLESVSRDRTVERHRPILIIAEGEMDATRLKERARWQASRNAGWSTTATVKVKGWRDDAGELWSPEKLVFVESKRLKISQPMAIKTVRFIQNGEGTITTMSLVDPRALGGKDAKGKSNAAWSTDIEEAN